MAAIATKDLDAMLDFVLEVREVEDVATFRSAVLAGLRRLIGCDSAGWTEVDPQRRSAAGVVDPDDVGFEGIERRFAMLMDEHPVLARARAGDGGPHSLSDFLSSRALHRLELYQDVYRLTETEDQLAFSLFGEVIVGVVLNRRRRGFSERDRTLAARLRPHLVQAYRQVRERESVAGLLAALDAGLSTHGTAMIVLDAPGRIAFATDAAQELLAAYFGHPWDGRAPAPPLEAWLGGGGETPLIAEGARGRLRVRRVDSCGVWRALILEELAVRPSVFEELRPLGVTKREAQVLRLLTRGKRNEQIAEELFISAATVRKHLQHIYAKLGVSSRAEAVAYALSPGEATARLAL